MAEGGSRKGRGTLSIEALKKAQQQKAAGKGRAQALKKLQEALACKNLAENLSQHPEKRDDEKKDLEKITKELETTFLDVPEEETEIRTFKGESGTPLRVGVNYIKLQVEEGKGVYEYEVNFSPPVDSKSYRCRIINEHFRQISTVKVFDGGSVLYLPDHLIESTREFVGTLPNSDETVTTIVTYKRKKRMSECLHLYNVLFKRIMYILLYTPMGRCYFDPNHRQVIPQHKLEIFPGYAITVDEVEDGLMVCLDTQHRVIRSTTVFELMQELYSVNPGNFKAFATQQVVGMSVLTRYNHKNYRIDDIAWNMSPKDTFLQHDNTPISFVDYYKRQYNIVINDVDQPLLLHKKMVNRMVNGRMEKQENMICLIPELSYLTGLTDAMRNDFRVMRDVAMFTRVTPNQRMQALQAYLDNVEKSDDAREILANWGLKMVGAKTDIQARTLDPETIVFGGTGMHRCNTAAEWNKAVQDNRMTGPINVLNWVVFHTPRDSKCVANFIETIVRMSKMLGCIVRPPKVVMLHDDRTESYTQACNAHLDSDVQVAVFVCPTLRTDRYATIKKVCCIHKPIASQVILSKTLNNQKSLRGIIHKIAMQITCKLGGSLWTVRIPFQGWMICGIDVYHETKKQSVCGFVSSLNHTLTQWYSKSIFQEHEIGDFFKIAFANSLREYYKFNGAFPRNVVIFRDGVGYGQLDFCKNYEIKQFVEALNELDIQAGLTFIVVQKRINTRIYDMSQSELTNPPPGTVLDSVVTNRNLYDFYLIPQNVRQGTVNPTHYIVLHDTIKWKPDQVQRLAYKLCHLYYNWCGTVRVPAPCLYAHKLAQLVGQVLKKSPAIDLDNRLFYL